MAGVIFSLTILQLVVLSLGHLRNATTDPADAVSASFNSTLQIGNTRNHEDAEIINSTQAEDDDVYLTKTEDDDINLTRTDEDDVNVTQTVSHGCSHKMNESAYSFIMINLDRRKDRLEAMESTLPPSLCRKTCRFPATDATTMSRPSYISEEVWSAAQNRQNNHKRTHGAVHRREEMLTLGAIGVIESSRRVWERIISLNTTAVVMEDDVVVSDEHQVLDALCMMQEYTHWQMAKFQYKKGHADVQKRPTLKIDPRRGVGEIGMYAITPTAAEKLKKRLAGGNKTSSQVDGLHGILKEVLDRDQVLRVEPAVAFQNGQMGTDIQILQRRESSCKIDICK